MLRFDGSSAVSERIHHVSGPLTEGKPKRPDMVSKGAMLERKTSNKKRCRPSREALKPGARSADSKSHLGNRNGLALEESSRRWYTGAVGGRRLAGAKSEGNRMDVAQMLVELRQEREQIGLAILGLEQLSRNVGGRLSRPPAWMTKIIAKRCCRPRRPTEPSG